MCSPREAFAVRAGHGASAGLARVSTLEQNPDLQVAELTAAGCWRLGPIMRRGCWTGGRKLDAVLRTARRVYRLVPIGHRHRPPRRPTTPRSESASIEASETWGQTIEQDEAPLGAKFHWANPLWARPDTISGRSLTN